MTPKFAPEQVPAVYNALDIKGEFGGKAKKLYGEVQQHLGGGKVRAISLGTTMGLRRGMDVIDTGGPLMVPVGKETLGRVFNLLANRSTTAGRSKTQAKNAYSSRSAKADGSFGQERDV